MAGEATGSWICDVTERKILPRVLTLEGWARSRAKIGPGPGGNLLEWDPPYYEIPSGVEVAYCPER